MKKFYCQISRSQDFEGTVECIKRAKDYVDYCVVVEHDYTKEQEEELKKLADNLILVRTVVVDNFPEKRNRYMKVVEERADDDTWVIVSDADEFFCKQFFEDLDQIIENLKANGYDMACINCREAFECVEWLDELDLLKECPGGYRESDYYKCLLFKFYKGLRYVGVGTSKNVHETFNKQDWKAIYLDKNKYWYEHRKSALKIWQRAGENFFIGGGGDNCLTEDSWIITDKGIKQIKDIEPGKDRVLNQYGRFVKVVRKIPRYYSGKVLKITVSHGITVKVTPDHRILVMQKVRKGGKNQFSGPMWIKAEDVKPSKLGHHSSREGHLAVFPMLNLETVDLNVLKLPYYRAVQGKKYLEIDTRLPEFWWLVGLYLSDGSSDVKGKTTFSLAKGEELAVVDMCRKIVGRSPRVHKGKSKNSCRIRCIPAPLGRFFRSEFGCGAHKKTIDYSLLGLNDECLENLIYGLLYGDGSYHKSKTNSDFYKLEMVNGNIVTFAFLAAIKCGYLPSIKIYEGRRKKKIKGREISSTPRKFRVTVNPRKTLYKLTGQRVKDYLVVSFDRIEEDFYEGYVYDLTVEEGESFSAPYIVFHNCGEMNPYWIPFREACKKYGITTSDELIRRIRNKEVPEEIEQFFREFISNKPIFATDYGREMRELAKFFYYHHPEKISEEIKKCLQTPPERDEKTKIEDYVRQTYFRVLGRHPDRDGLEYWTRMILEGKVLKRQLPEIFRRSSEYRQKFGEDVKVNVPVDVKVHLSQDAMLQALRKSEIWWRDIKPRLDLARFLESMIDNKEEFYDEFYAKKELEGLSLENFFSLLTKYSKDKK